MEVDVKDSSPARFWATVVGLILTLSGGSGATSYLMAQDATEQTARAVAEAAVRDRIAELRVQVGANTTSSIEVKNDIRWIRETLQRIEREMRRDRGE